MLALGYNTAMYKTFVFALAGGLAGLAGALYDRARTAWRSGYAQHRLLDRDRDPGGGRRPGHPVRRHPRRRPGQLCELQRHFSNVDLSTRSAGRSSWAACSSVVRRVLARRDRRRRAEAARPCCGHGGRNSEAHLRRPEGNRIMGSGQARCRRDPPRRGRHRRLRRLQSAQPT